MGTTLRLLIFGAPGSGKTYLATRLSDRYSILHTSLDDLFWSPESGSFSVRRSEAERLELLMKVVTDESWIVEGVYYSWVTPAVEAADLVIVLLPPRWKRQLRICKRYCYRMLFDRSHRRERFREFLSLFRYNGSFDRVNVPMALRTFANCSSRIEMFSDADSAYVWMISHK